MIHGLRCKSIAENSDDAVKKAAVRYFNMMFS